MKNHTRPRTLPATAAARDFSGLLDKVEAGAEFVIERHSRPVARIAPALAGPRRLSACIAVDLARPSAAPDADFAADLAAIRAGHAAYAPPAWE